GIKVWNAAVVEHRPFQGEGLPVWKASGSAHLPFLQAALVTGIKRVELHLHRMDWARDKLQGGYFATAANKSEFSNDWNFLSSVLNSILRLLLSALIVMASSMFVSRSEPEVDFFR